MTAIFLADGRPNTIARGAPLRRAGASAALAALLLAVLPFAASAQEASVGRSSGLPLPRFVSLASGEVNVREGPTTGHRIAFTYVRAGLPVEIIAESDNWRHIRGPDGEEGWVFHSLLAGTRTVLVAPWSAEADPLPLHRSADAASATTAWLAPGVQARVQACDGTYCRLEGSGFSGWLEQNVLWGVYPDEVFD